MFDATITGTEKIPLHGSTTFTLTHDEIDNPIIAWYKDGKLLPRHTGYTLEFHDVEWPGEGAYNARITGEKDGSPITALTNTLHLEIIGEPDDNICPDWYVHQLDEFTVFTYIGWWIIDEIQRAKKLNINWLDNPHDNRLRYNCSLSYYSRIIGENSTVYIQESRHGRILDRAYFLDSVK